ncbi:hypothetical protein SAMN04488074_102415 [Lentzea albidocapillata subsp. violacea]|uniref:Uncharacterized protein n=1 Tax=Lentzea albidocapillata subsp. violacea TaxID=128104 RepID=A0A1G8UUD0_9PSEU|nr:hypothetical protein [Lentzea albidocapillata]SDJ57486.1 hypothetical protein SAMN04488074_102415 [Lentzea albidocapillata subsp. violacea]
MERRPRRAEIGPQLLALHSTPPEFADALAEAYGVTRELRDRALIWHRLGPWHEVLYGNDIGDPELVEVGLAGVRDRLGTGVPHG